MGRSLFGISKVRMICGLIALMAVGMGFVNLSSNDQLIQYHNEFARKAYQEVVIEGWNVLVDKANEDSSTPEALAKYVRSSMIPRADVWRAKAINLKPPELAKDFHAKLTADLAVIDEGCKEIALSLERDADNSNDKFTRVGLAVSKTGSDIVDLQKMLTKERGMSFQKADTLTHK